MSTSHPLDELTRAALLGPHARFAEAKGEVLRYHREVAPFVALPAEPTPQAWQDLAALLGPGEHAMLAGDDRATPAGWQRVFQVPGVQLIAEHLAGVGDPEAVVLGPADVPDMLALVALTKPGPFLPRTIELGSYLGIRRGGKLIAMAGERLRTPGWTEISAVCTDPAWQGNGLARRLVLAVTAGIRDRGDRPFMHAAASNTNAIRLYQKLGFELRRTVFFQGFRPPAS